MTKYYVDLDFVDAANTNAAAYNLEARTLQEDGPAGGNPVVRLTGTYDDLTSYIWSEYSANDDKSAEFISSLINELPEE